MKIEIEKKKNGFRQEKNIFCQDPGAPVQFLIYAHIRCAYFNMTCKVFLTCFLCLKLTSTLLTASKRCLLVLNCFISNYFRPFYQICITRQSKLAFFLLSKKGSISMKIIWYNYLLKQQTHLCTLTSFFDHFIANLVPIRHAICYTSQL